MSSCPVALCSCIFLILSSRLRQGAPAHFFQQPSDQVVVMGQSVTLACGVHGYRGLVQWTKDGLALGGQRDLPGWPRYNLQGDVSLGEHNLHIENAQLEDDAVYECQATQIALRSRRSQVKILVPPSIPVILGAPIVTVRARTLHNLTCSSTGSKPTPQMSWYRDGELQDTSFSIKRLMEDGKQENITSVLSIIPERSDSGCIFTCRVSNAADPSGKQSSVTLNVHYAPEVSLSAQPDPALERSKVTFSCLVKANPGQVTYRWAKGQTALTGVRGQHYQTEVDRSFFGEPVSCAVTNAVGSTNASVLLDVHFGPQLVTEPLPLTVDPGEDASFVCRWLGNPPLALTWSRQGSDTVLGNSETLRLRAVTQEDSGIYVCRAAVPGIGTGETEVRLTVNGPPIIQTEVEQWGVPGEQAQIHCFIGSHPSPDRVAWSWRENVLESGALGRFRADTVTTRQGTTSTLSVDRSAPSDYNVLYNCSAHNRFGSRTSSIALRERDPCHPHGREETVYCVYAERARLQPLFAYSKGAAAQVLAALQPDAAHLRSPGAAAGGFSYWGSSPGPSGGRPRVPVGPPSCLSSGLVPCPGVLGEGARGLCGHPDVAPDPRGGSTPVCSSPAEGLRLGVVAGATGGLAVLLVTFLVTLGSICSRRRQGGGKFGGQGGFAGELSQDGHALRDVGGGGDGEGRVWLGNQRLLAFPPPPPRL
ncbi:kin of IRRE-like protein 3 [Pristis pectinata]|uniref:kin of IRRE-like protein 3 n=1 Tax=Pristis pectinata TaxID=685728 RepID=UPI00223D9998|nr:kin of IRRE-like protein 3 [Pristis pectinata]